MKKNTHSIYKITIGIPAYNEQANIKRLLKSLIAQKIPSGFDLTKIVVVSDGSIDKTVERVNSLKDDRIKLLNFSQRLGKNTRLNQLFTDLKDDILVLFDADTLLSDNQVIANLTQHFSKINHLCLVAGNAQPLKAKTMVEAAINNFVFSLNFMKSKINSGNNIYSVRGPIIAISKNFAHKITLPKNVPDDRYLYLKCKQLKFNFRFSEKALVHYRSPQTLDDQLNQGFRFLKDKENLYAQFDENLINKEYQITLKLKISMLIFQILKNPLAYLTMKLIHLRILLNRKKQLDYKWKIVISSKNLI